MRINHIAIVSKHPDQLAVRLFGCKVVCTSQEHPDASVWIELEDSIILMIEKAQQNHNFNIDSSHSYFEKRPGFFLLSFDISHESQADWRKRLAKHDVSIEEESKYTIYFYDPDGNRIALSHFKLPG